MTLPLDHERYCAEIGRQTALLRDCLRGADLAATVPTCPDWSLRELAVHVGGAHRWVEMMVRTKAADEIPEEQTPGFLGPDGDDPAALDAWLADGAQRLVSTLRAAGPDTEVWTWAWERGSAFWARRMTHETALHRADAAHTVRARYELAPEVAADAIDEWLDIVRFAQRTEPEDSAAELRGGGRSLHLHATDTTAALDAEWLIEFGDDGFTWRRGHDKATVALRGPLTDVLQVFYRRLPVDSERVEVLGERELLDFWLERATFG
ncbi:maleylpyruvate isomerase family mycothiol-dependent enzyme [Streptomyces sp. O3]